jgi:hypothetical protein
MRRKRGAAHVCVCVCAYHDMIYSICAERCVEIHIHTNGFPTFIGEGVEPEDESSVERLAIVSPQL